MNTELKEKMRREINAYLQIMQEGGCIPNFEENDFNAGVLYGAEQGFFKGYQTMYSELKEQIEWVSVEDRLPEKDGLMCITKTQDSSGIRKFQPASLTF